MNATSRPAMTPVSRRMRAYFAPMDRQSGSPAVFDPAQGMFLLDAPPEPWLDLGWIDNFERLSGTKTELLRSGTRGVVSGQFRADLNARLEFNFRQWGKLQMALACGSEHINVLATRAEVSPKPSGGNPVPGVAVLPESTAIEIVFGVGAIDSFSVGDILAIDVDYEQETGYVGTGIAAAYVQDPADVKHDSNFVRRVTFNVGRIAEKTVTAAVLGQPLPGGAPALGASAQKVAAFVDREGGSFFQEWSALFIAEEDSGGRVCFYYPRLTATGALKSEIQREQFVEIAEPLSSMALRASFLALPYTDDNDGQVVVCYRSYFPAPMAAVY